MKPKTLILLGVAIACGLGASYMTSRLLAERQSDDEPKITVLVARKALNMGEPIKAPEELFQEKKFTRGDEPAGPSPNRCRYSVTIRSTATRSPTDPTARKTLPYPTTNASNAAIPIGSPAVGAMIAEVTPPTRSETATATNHLGRAP